MRLALDTRTQALVGAAALLIGSAIVVRLAYLPLIARWRDSNAQVSELHVKIEDARTLMPRLVEEEASLQQTRLQLNAALASIGSEASVARMLETLQHHAETLHVEFSATKSADAEDTGSPLTLAGHVTLRQVPIAVTLIGHYRQIGAFLATLDGASFLAQVQRLSLKRESETSSTMEAHMTLALYVVDRTQPARAGASASP